MTATDGPGFYPPPPVSRESEGRTGGAAPAVRSEVVLGARASPCSFNIRSSPRNLVSPLVLFEDLATI